MIKSFFALVLLVVFFSCNKNLNKSQADHFYIHGKSENIADSTTVYLKVQVSNNIIPLDTTFAINGSFYFEDKINKPEVYGIYIDSIKGFIGLFIENDSVFIEINENDLTNSKIIGSKLQMEYDGFIKKSNNIISKANYLFPLFQKARTENDVEKLNKINKEIEAIHKKNRTYILNFARKNPNSYVSAFVLQTLLKDKSISKDTIAAVYKNFSHKVKQGDFAIEILLYLESQS